MADNDETTSTSNCSDRKKDLQHDDQINVKQVLADITAIIPSFKQFIADDVTAKIVEPFKQFIADIVSSRGVQHDDDDDDYDDLIIRKINALVEAIKENVADSGFKMKHLLIDLEGFPSDEFEKFIKGDANVEKKGKQIECEGNTTAEVTFKQSEEEDAQHGAKDCTSFKMKLFLIRIEGFVSEIEKLMKGDANVEKQDIQIESHSVADAAKGNTSTSKAFIKIGKEAQHGAKGHKSMRC